MKDHHMLPFRAAEQLAGTFLTPHTTLPEQVLAEKYPLQKWSIPTADRHPLRRFHPQKKQELSYIDSGFSRCETKDSHDPAIIILPGTFTDLENVRPDVAALSSTGIRTLALDYVTAGSLDTFMQQFPAFLHDVGIHGNIILYGMSLGGVIAQYMSRSPLLAQRIQAMILSHTAYPQSKVNFANLSFRGLELVRVIEQGMRWKWIKKQIDRQNAKNGVRKFSPGNELGQLDYQVAHSLLRLSDVSVPKLHRERAHGFLDFFLDATKSARRPKRTVHPQPFTLPMLWIYTEKDPVLIPERPENVQKLYPQARFACLPPKYEHHSLLYRRATTLTQHVAPFIAQHVG